MHRLVQPDRWPASDWPPADEMIARGWIGRQQQVAYKQEEEEPPQSRGDRENVENRYPCGEQHDLQTQQQRHEIPLQLSRHAPRGDRERRDGDCEEVQHRKARTAARARWRRTVLTHGGTVEYWTMVWKSHVFAHPLERDCHLLRGLSQPLDVYPEDSVWTRDQMRSFGHNPDDTLLSKTAPVGNSAGGAHP